MNDIEILEWVCINKLYIDTHNECDYHNIHTAIENLIQRNKDLEQILELTSKSLDNISYDQIPIAIEELKFKLQDLEQIEKEHKEENGRLRGRIKELEEYANWHIEHLTEDIADYIDDDKVGNASIIGDFKEEREHWRDINRILNNKKTYIDYKNY